MKKEELKISHTVYPDKEYSFNEISDNIKSELKYTSEQRRTLAIVDGFIEAHEDLKKDDFTDGSLNPFIQENIIKVLNRLKDTLKNSYIS